MAKINKKKLLGIGTICFALAITAISFQNFTINETTKELGKSSGSLTDALTAALKSAEADTTERQIALNVEPSQIQKAAFKKRRNPDVILGSDNNPNWYSKERSPASEAAASADSETKEQ